MSRSYKLFVGRKIREIRTDSGLTQAEFSEKLGISTSYFNQIENNQRHVTASVMLALAEQFAVDISTLSTGHGDRLLADLTEVLADPLFAEQRPTAQDIKLVTQNAPSFAYAMLALHSGFKKTGEQLAELDNSIISTGTSVALTPYEEVRDFFHYKDNYIDELDLASEHLSQILADKNISTLEKLSARLENKHRISVIKRTGRDAALESSNAVREFDKPSKTLYLGANNSNTTNSFQLAYQIAQIEYADLIAQIADKANYRSEEAVEICKIGLANYFAGALILPYEKFATTAKEERHDIDALAATFDASLEQISHRLSTLQRPGKKGVPFFFAKVDQAGNITKRHSATKLQFARYGAACPLWNAHQAFETPNQIIRQLAETPDGTRYLCLATEVSRRGNRYRKPVRRFSLALGCETKYVDQLVYADDLDLLDPSAVEPIGVSCRICERTNCMQRAVPPIHAHLDIDLNRRGTLPYKVR